MMGLSPGVSVFAVIVIVFILRDLITLNQLSSSEDSNSNSLDNEDDLGHSHHDMDVDDNKVHWKAEIGGPGSKISSAKFIGPEIKIFYCSSYQNAYDQYAQFIHEKYPEISVEGIYYPLPAFRKIAGQVLTVLKFVLLGTMLTNQWSLFRILGIPPRFIAWITENKMYASLVFFFVVNLVEVQLSSTGAFEVNIDDVPVWSKIQTGRLPNPPELVQMIENHLKLGGLDANTFHIP